MDDPFTFTFTGRERIPKYVKHVIISEELDCVPFRSFAWNSTIESVVGHAGIRTIEKCAFYECTSLSYVNFPGVVEIEEDSFVHCKKLPFVRFPNLEVVGQYAFCDCVELEFIDLPSVRIVEDSGFQDCTKLVGAIFGSRLENLQRMVFRGCFSLEYVSLPLKAGVIKCDDTFYQCRNLVNVRLVEEPVLNDTVMCLQLHSWRNTMNLVIGSISPIISFAHPGHSIMKVPVMWKAGDKARTINRWIRSVLRDVNLYKRYHQEFLEEAATTLNLVLPQEIVTTGIIPFLELPPHEFEALRPVDDCDVRRYELMSY